MSTVAADLLFAARLLRRNPGYALAAILTLALGIGANTTMFSVVNATLLRRVPYPEPDRLAILWTGSTDDPTDLGIVSLPNYRDWREQSRSFESMALFDSAGRGYNLSDGPEPEQVSGVRVTASFFSVLGIPPLLGRTFLPEEEEPGRDREVVLSYGLWNRRYGADRSLVGRAITIDGERYIVVGVMPQRFQFQFWSGPRQLFVPAGYTPGDLDRGSQSFVALARLARGVTLDRARAEMDGIGRRLSHEYPQTNPQGTVRVTPLAEYGMAGLRMTLVALLAAVGFVLLIACANVANLMLARAAARQREMAIRSALGAGRGRILRQLLTESVLLSGLGGLAGLLLAAVGTSTLAEVLPRSVRLVPFRPVERIDVDATVLGFTLAVSVLAGLLFGLAPALGASRGDLNQALKESTRGSTQGGRGRLRSALVASEVALTLVVLAGAGLMIATVARLLGVDPGLDPRNVLTLEISLPQENLYYGPPAHAGFCRDLATHVGSLPGVVSASSVAHLPLSGGWAARGFVIEGRPKPEPENMPGAGYSVACPDYLRTMGIPLLTGREFTQADRVGTPQVILVNASMARRYWPGQDPLGRRIKLGLHGDEEAPWLTVVGVFGDVRHYGLDASPEPNFLRPYAQAAWPYMHIVVRTAAAPAAFVAPVKEALLEIEPGRPVSRVQTMEQVVAGSVGSRRFSMQLLAAFAALALLLAAVGVAGVVGYSVVQRTQEIGIRVALGARPADILRLVVGSSLAWTLGGLAAGLAAATGLLRFLRDQLYGVGVMDPIVLSVVSLVMLAVALGATYVPARRAMRVNPVDALRCE
jgi:predicted permease